MRGGSVEDWRSARFHEPQPKAGDLRTPGERDRDRVLYSPEFRRLQGVTQVILAAEEGYLQHNRLTHSLKVAQVGRRIAERLLRTYTELTVRQAIDERGGLDPDVVEAAGLAHDLGHPPFGHIAEHQLQTIMHKAGLTDTFEGNAQSFRIVVTLSARSPGFPGLNLTRATINAILKYPWRERDAPQGETPHRKWGAYEENWDVAAWARDGVLHPLERSLEADIMDWADDITYAVHDVEDFYRVGLIPLDRLRQADSELLPHIYDRVRRRLGDEANDRYRLSVSQKDVEAAWAETLGVFGRIDRDDSFESRAAISAYSSGLINNFVRATELDSKAHLVIPKALRIQAEMLKNLTRIYVVEAPHLATQQQGQRRVIENLFAAYSEPIKSAGIRPSDDESRRAAVLFPTRIARSIRQVINEGSAPYATGRVVADTIAGMTEAQALRIHHRFMGFDLGAFVDPAVS